MEKPQPGDAFANEANLLFGEPAGLIATVARHARHRVALVQKGDRAGDFVLVDAQLARQAAEVDRYRRCHEQSRPGYFLQISREGNYPLIPSALNIASSTFVRPIASRPSVKWRVPNSECST